MLLLKNIFRCLGICIFCLPSKEEGGENGRAEREQGWGAATNNIFAIFILSTSDYSFAVCHHVTREQNKTPAWHRLGKEKQAKPFMQKGKNEGKDPVIPHCCGWQSPLKVIKSKNCWSWQFTTWESTSVLTTQMELGTGCCSLHTPRVSPRCPHIVWWGRMGSKLY